MKTKNLIVFFFCIALAGCSQKLDNKIAAEVIRNSFSITDSNRISIVGISNESAQTDIVIFRIKSGVDMSVIESSAKLRKFDKGWNFEGLQNKLGMYINPGDFIKEYSELEITKLKNLEATKATMKTMEFIAKGIEQYIKANGQAPNCFWVKDLHPILVPKYSQEFPEEDSWGSRFYYYSGANGDLYLNWIKNGTNRKVDKADYLLVSQGPNKDLRLWEFDPELPNAGILFVKDLEEISKINLVLFNGKWVLAPKFEFEK